MKCSLGGALTTYRAAEIRSQLLGCLAVEGPFELDTRSVMDVDATGLQLLLAALKSASTAKKHVIFPATARGRAVTNALGLLGLDQRDWNREG